MELCNNSKKSVMNPEICCQCVSSIYRADTELFTYEPKVLGLVVKVPLRGPEIAAFSSEISGTLVDRLMGVFLIALSAACFGVNPIFVRIAFDTGTNPETFLFIRFAIASVVMVVILAANQLK